MLVRLMPNNIANLWDSIRSGLEASLPPIVGEVPYKMTNILNGMLEGSLQCWVSYEKETKQPSAYILTTVVSEGISGTKNLLIYCVYGFENITEKQWAEGLEALKTFGKSRGCSMVTAYTELPYIEEVVKSLGGEAKFRFLTFPIYV
jgi:hypothetical protein